MREKEAVQHKNQKKNKFSMSSSYRKNKSDKKSFHHFK